MQFLVLCLISLLTLIDRCRAYCPVVILPGAGNDSVDYGKPLEQPSDVDLNPVLARREFESDSSGQGDLLRDGAVPFVSTQFESATSVDLPGVVHSSSEAGTIIPTNRRQLQLWVYKLMASPEGRAGCSRRSTIKNIIAATSISICMSTEKAEAMYENAPVAVSEITKLPSGVTYQDLRQGDGVVVSEGNRVNIQWSLKRSNGYIIDSSSSNDGVPFIFVVGNTSKDGTRAIKGLDEGIRGMKVGGIRRIIMPPSQTFVEGLADGSPGPIPPGFGPKQRIDRVMKLRADVPDESFLLDVKPTRVQ